MSYILDALKKSDKDRRRGETPNIYTPQIEPPSLPNSDGKKKLILIASGGAAFLAFCLILFMLLRPSPPQRDTAVTVPRQPAVTAEVRQEAAVVPPSRPLSTAGQTQNSAPRESVPSELDAIPEARPAVVIRDNTEPPNSAQDMAENEETVIENPVQYLKAEKQKARFLPDHLKASNVVIKPVQVMQTQRVAIPYLELPANIRNELPELKFAGHTYAQTPLSRLIIINSKILREGGMISPDLRLFEITPDGVILDFRGTVFSLKVD